jgi:hypothetical protein
MKTDLKDQGTLRPQTGVLTGRLQRRSFLQYAGAGMAGVALLAVGCEKNNNMVAEAPSDTGVTLGSNDTGILNYAYALEQLEAAFYDQVIKTPYTGISAVELSLLTDVRDHELAHRDFFKAALGSAAIASLEFDFSSIKFSERSSVLATAKAFEDLGVSAYNGAGKLIKSGDYLTLAGKIVSVEARHAALIRNLIESGSFANSEVVDANGLDKARTPAEVLAIAKTYIKTPINASTLPA